MRTFGFSLVLLTLATVVGCRSRVVEVTLVNTSQLPLSIIVVDYPGATFGVNQLAPSATYHYAIKPQNTGALKIQFTDAQGQNHTYTGPELHKNDEGGITVRLTQDSAISETYLSAR